LASPALPGRAHDLNSCPHPRIIRICARQGVPIVANLAYQGADPWGTAGIKRRPHRELTPTEETMNRARAHTRVPVERGVRLPEALADLPSRSLQPEPHDVNRQSIPHSGAAPLKKLTEPLSSSVSADQEGVDGGDDASDAVGRASGSTKEALGFQLCEGAFARGA
jgi:hypothetical protein